MGQLQVHPIDPTETDASISGGFGVHQALVDLGVSQNGQLLLFLPGTEAEPRAYQHVLTEGAELGYHVVGLAYPDSEALATACGSDLTCYEPARLEIFDGIDRSSQVSVDPANSILNRFVKVLQFLDAKFPSEDWGGFLQNGNPRWGEIAVAGHSQGGGEAAIIGKTLAVARVALFSAPIDSSNGVPADWVGPPLATPVSQYFGFVQQFDPAFSDITTNWVALGMGDSGSLTSVDNTSPPYGGSHELQSGRFVLHPHNATAVDADTPFAGGVPVYKPVWDTLLGP